MLLPLIMLRVSALPQRSLFCCLHPLNVPIAVLLRSWEDLNLDDVDIRMKWAGLFHRAKRTPKKFMMRIKVCVCVRLCVCLCPAHPEIPYWTGLGCKDYVVVPLGV